MKPYLALKASAGSGKTFALTVRYISLLLLDAKPNEILTLTFTNKAAAQMASRIYENLLNLGEDKAILEAITKETSLSVEQILQKKAKLIESFIQNELAIYTIDKFINKILREFSGYIGINDDFEIKFDDEELLLYKFLVSLSETQFESLIAFAHLENKKLNSIVELFKLLEEKNEAVETTKYPKGSYEAVKVAILEEANIIKEFVEKSDLSNSALNAVDFQTVEQLLEKGKTWLTKESLSEFNFFKKAKPPVELDEVLAKLKQHIVLYYQIQESFTLKSLYEIFENFKKFRQNYNTKRNSLEFSDITNIVYQLLKNYIQKDFLYFRLDAKYHHILIDEFQDTSTLQFKILYHLIEEIISGNPEIFKTFFYVGDTKQSIYRFRGGTKELFDFVAQSFHPMVEVEILDTNYRSSQSVVNFVNTTFGKLTNYPYDNQKANSSIEGFVEVVQVQEGEKEAYYDGVCQKVQELLEKGVAPNNIAILTYTNADVLAIYEALKLKFPTLDVTTEMTSKLINQHNVKAVINGIKYLYFQEEIYRVNFNALVGREYFEPFDFKIDIQTNDIITIVKELSYYFHIVDENVIRLIEICSGYPTLVDFVYDIEKDDTTMVSQNKTGVTILTIFKSKGLEFDTVIVCDRVTKKVPNRTSLLFDYHDIELQKIYYKRANRENFDSLYEKAIENEKKLVIGDELNILYVALTRAKNNMIVIKKEKNSVFEYLQEFALQRVGTLYINSHQEGQKSHKIALEYLPLKLGYQEKEKESAQKETLLSRYFGLATHYCLEMMKQFDLQSLEKAIVLTENKFVNLLTKEQIDDIFSRIFLLIGDKVFQSIVEKGLCIKEQSLIFGNEHKIIDLLVQHEDGFVIIDYKTTQEKSISHITQVQNYTEAIQNIFASKQVRGYIVYLQHKNIEIVEVKNG